MSIATSSRYALSVTAAAALLGGCGGPLAPQSFAPSHTLSPARHATKNSGWLYVADDAFSVGIVYIFGYADPNGSQVKAITRIGNVYGPCADSGGHVWVPAERQGRPFVVEFAAGTTKRIGKLDLPKGSGLGECAVDPVTGNLAVVGTNSVNVFAEAKGRSTKHSLAHVSVTACAYDDQGNLFVDGMKPISTSQEAFVLYQLPKGGKTFSAIALDKRTGVAGGLEWDGQYVAVATGGNGVKPVIYRLSISGSKGTVVQSVHPRGLNFQAWFAVANGQMIGTSGIYAPRVRDWPYPAGGGWTWEIGRLQTRGLAIVRTP